MERSRLTAHGLAILQKLQKQLWFKDLRVWGLKTFLFGHLEAASVHIHVDEDAHAVTALPVRSPILCPLACDERVEEEGRVSHQGYIKIAVWRSSSAQGTPAFVILASHRVKSQPSAVAPKDGWRPMA